ncbi:MAG: hypothetical protein AVDCRST_MAG89-4575 [uncultured Gemmatimonadetes bacterium]|uniref:Uncharacterized protein n=1 Tax=uncultured Gemmatimonadota bacterium TaxID=203437 RepID=A0A6J4N221_9BACT|nr:MAG: hypothetical protein AVDCRST_MAG89-4575 [uncultured Gemmatimonadota bacterium]
MHGHEFRMGRMNPRQQLRKAFQPAKASTARWERPGAHLGKGRARGHRTHESV